MKSSTRAGMRYGAAVLCWCLGASGPVGALAADTVRPAPAAVAAGSSGRHSAPGDRLGAIAAGLQVSAWVRTGLGFRSASLRGRAGVTTASSTSQGFEATGDAAALRGLLAVPGVQSVEILDQAVPAAVSEGLGTMDVALLWNQGLTGSGVKIAVVDVGFDGYQSLLGSDLPTAVTVRDFRDDPLPYGGTSHGTAVAEIVYDLAPGAQFYLITVADELDFALAVDYLIAEGIDVANMSAGWLMGPFDGTSFQATQVDRAAAAGIVWVNSAGNFADSHWGGDFSDPNGDGWMAFSPSADFNSFSVAPNTYFQVAITWASGEADYDLYLFDGNGVEIGDSSRDQAAGAPPQEYITWQNTSASAAVYSVRVDRFSGGTYRVDAFFSGVSGLTAVSADRSIITPGDASGAVTTGAVAWNDWSVIESFSSQGPTVDGRPKPDLVGPDGVTTTVYGWRGFSGTSASSPHVAGLAALYLQRDPTLSPAQVKAALMGDATDLGSPGWDPVFGSGLARAGAPVGAPTAPSGVTAASGNGLVTVSWLAPPAGGTAISDYVIQYRPKGTADWVVFGDGVSTAVRAVVTGLSNGTSYEFRVAAANVVGVGGWSAVAEATPGTATLPGNPWGTLASPGSRTVKVEWKAPSDGGSPITDYVIQYRKTGTTAWTVWADGVGIDPHAHVTGLSNGTKYDFRVAAQNSVGTSIWCAVFSAISGGPSRPLAVVATPGSRQVALAWAAPASTSGSAITDYVIQYRQIGTTGWVTFRDGVSTSRHTHVTGLTGGINYQFRIAAKNARGAGVWSAVVAATAGA